MVALTVSAFVSSRLVVAQQREVRVILEVVTLTALVFTTSLSLDGIPLVLCWSACAVALAPAALRGGGMVARAGALAFLGLVVGHVLVFEAPPSALVEGLGSVASATMGLVLVAGLAIGVERLDPTSPIPPVALRGVAATASVYLGSVLMVTVFDGGARQQGQSVLSVYWATCGIIAMVIGLRRDSRVLRLCGLGLLALSAAKVFVLDLSILASGYRVVSFLGLGMLLLAAAFAHQRLRATEPRDRLEASLPSA